jgi:gluconolactonase
MMKISHVMILTGLAIGSSAAVAEGVMRGDGPAPEPRPFHINKADPSLDAVIAPDAQLELLADGFGLTEGPIWIDDPQGGYLLVAGLIDNAFYKITPQKQVSVFMEFAGYTGDRPDDVGTQTRSGRSHVLLIGPSCANLDRQGRLLWCAMQDRAVKRLESDGRVTVLSDGSDGKRYSGPNDIAVKSNGDIYLTDNDFGLRGAGNSPQKEMPNGVFLIRNGRSERLLTRVALGGPPNGIALSADERYLYLSAGAKLMRYEIRSDGTLGTAMLFNEGEGIGDGMKVDKKGDVFCTGGASTGIVRIVSPEGRYLGSLQLPTYSKEPKKQICATNLTFGDRDGKSLYITACDAVYRIRLRTEGIVPGPPR